MTLQDVESVAWKFRCFEDFAHMAATVGWEMLLNAFAARGGGRGDSKVTRAVDLRICHVKDALRIIVSDPFGSLVQKQVIDSLVRSAKREADQVKRDERSAGIGLYMMLHS